MSCINLHDQFLSYISINPQHSSDWNASLFMKSSNQALREVEILKTKLKQLETIFSRNRLLAKQKQLQMVNSLKDNVRICENCLKKIRDMTPDMKTTKHKFLEQYKTSIVTTMEMKLLQAELKFKKIYQQFKNYQFKPNNGIQSSALQAKAPNLNRSHFIEQSHQQIMEEITTNQYKGIQKQISKISTMYKQTAIMIQLKAIQMRLRFMWMEAENIQSTHIEEKQEIDLLF